MEKTKVALMGLGTMGFGMAGRLLEAGYPLTVYNRTKVKAEELARRGAIVAASPAEAAAGAEIIFSIVSDDDASRALWLGPRGALQAADPGAVLVESSTLTVEWVRELENAAKARGLFLIDAPVTGSRPQAANGQLRFLAGGSKTVLDRITPALRVMGRDVIHLGPTGAGTRMKLINNFMAAVQAATVAEAIGLIERTGLNLDQALRVLTEGAPGSPMVRSVAQRMVDREYTPPYFSAKLMAKDLRYALVLASQNGVELDTATSALKLFEAAVDTNRGGEDLAVIAELFRGERAAGDQAGA